MHFLLHHQFPLASMSSAFEKVHHFELIGFPKKKKRNLKKIKNDFSISKVINGSHQAVNGMYPIFEPGQKNFSNHNRNDWDNLNRELWVCKRLLPFVRKGNSGAQLYVIYEQI